MTDIMKQYNQLQRAYEAQAEENADLALLADQYKAERDALAAKLDELQRQEPVAYWIPKAEQFCIADKSGRPFAKAWQPLYAAPKALEPLTDDWIRKRCNQTWVFNTVKQWVREVEAAHGIGGTP